MKVKSDNCYISEKVFYLFTQKYILCVVVFCFKKDGQQCIKMGRVYSIL